MLRRDHHRALRVRRELVRDAAKNGEPVSGRIVNTSSGAGLLGSTGQAAYSAAKAGIVGLTLVQAAELGRPARDACAGVVAVLRDGSVLALDDPQAGTVQTGDRLVVVGASSAGQR